METGETNPNHPSEALSYQLEDVPNDPSPRSNNATDGERAHDVLSHQTSHALQNILPSAEGHEEATGCNCSVTLSHGVADLTDTEANPSGLDWHHGEKQLMAARHKLDEVIASTERSSGSEETRDKPITPSQKDFTQPACQDLESMDSAECLRRSGHDEAVEQYLDIALEERRSEKQADGGVNFNRSEEKWQNLKVEQEILSQDQSKVETNVQSDVTSHQSCDAADQAVEPPENPANEKQRESVEGRSLDYGETESDTGTSQSAMGESQVLSQASGEMVEQQQEVNRRISDIQQGEELLQRLQMIQLRHDEGLDEHQALAKDFRQNVENGSGIDGTSFKGSEGSHGIGEDVIVTKGGGSITNEDGKTEGVCLATTIGLPPHQQTCEDSEDDPSDGSSPSDLSEDLHKTGCPKVSFPSGGHRFSAGETFMERQIQEAVQGRQNLQRVGGVFNLAENPDILEIPFQTDLSLESLLAKACSGSQRGQWQFSEKKMQKEIKQDTRRETVLVNQGKIPGDYSKGATRQLKETKLLFEAFQQDNTGGPTRNRKPRALTVKGQVYPSVLERTRSLERFSFQSCPLPRTHSLRLHNSPTLEREKRFETLRTRSPTGVIQTTTHLSPYLRQDKLLRVHRSMDSICRETLETAGQAGGKSKMEHTRQSSPILKHNPFFKLRPALSLQPDVEKDIREAKEREEELRRQRCSLYGENRQTSEDEAKAHSAKAFNSGERQKSWRKLERVWPPPPPQKKSEQAQESKVHKAGGQKASLWQRWESGQINGQPPSEK